MPAPIPTACQNVASQPVPPRMTAEVPATAASRAGYMSGTKSIAKMKAPPLVFTAMVARNVPTPAMPIDPTMAESASIQNGPAIGRPDMKATANTGTVTISTMSRKMRLPTAFAKKMTGLSTGVSRSASRQPWSFSCTSERFSPSIEVKTNASHTRPAAMSRMSKPEPLWDNAI
jgi:hypothetical protein